MANAPEQEQIKLAKCPNKLVVMLIINHVKRKDAFQYLTVCWCHATTYSCKFMWLCIKYFKSYKGAFPETSCFEKVKSQEIGEYNRGTTRPSRPYIKILNEV